MFMLGVLNASVSEFYLRKVSSQFRGGYIALTRQFIEQLPVPESNLAQRRTIEVIAGCIVWLHARSVARENLQETTGDPLMAAFFEQWVNALVYELFFPQELHAADLHFFDLIQALTQPPLETLAESDRLPELQKLFKTTYASDHKLRQALYRLGSLDLVRTIEGKA
jgi:DNA-binding FadR family transcriptional regulator